MAKKPAKSKAKKAKAAKSKAKKAKPAKRKTKPAPKKKPVKAAAPKARAKAKAKSKAKATPKAKGKAKAPAKAPPATPSTPDESAASTEAMTPDESAEQTTSEEAAAGSASTPEEEAELSTPTGTITSASKAAGNAGATTNLGPSWKAALRDELAKLPDDFAAYCAERGANADGAWEAADSDALRGLEAWGRELADRNRQLGVAALVAAAQVGFPRAMNDAGEKANDMGFHASEAHADGAPVETQIARGAAWLAEPSDAKLEDVVASFDATRQLNVWDEDLLPQSDDDVWFWYYEVGQCIAHAISGQGGEPEGASYYEWTPSQSVGRGLVMAVRGLRKGGDDAAVIELLRTGIAG